MVKIDTQGIEAEIYADPRQLDNIFYLIDNERYAIKEQKLVKISDPLSESIIKPYAIDYYSVILNNGGTDTVSKSILKGTHTRFTSSGPSELRRLRIANSSGTISEISRSLATFGIVVIAPTTGTYRFSITNFSATTQQWNCEIEF